MFANRFCQTYFRGFVKLQRHTISGRFNEDRGQPLTLAILPLIYSASLLKFTSTNLERLCATLISPISIPLTSHGKDRRTQSELALPSFPFQQSDLAWLPRLFCHRSRADPNFIFLRLTGSRIYRRSGGAVC